MRYNPLSRIKTDDPAQGNAWEEACRIARRLKERYPKCTVRTFGSLVRPNAWSPRSDIDIAVSGIPGFSWEFAWKVHEEFPKYEVQVVSTDLDPSAQASKIRDFSQEFIGEILAAGIEIPAPIRTISCEPELVIMAGRLDKVAGHMTEELRKFFDVDAMDLPDFIKCGAFMCHANRYRYRMERGLGRVVGFIDRCKPKYGEEDERLRLYKIAAADVPGLRPALLSPEIAIWHSEFVKLEYALMDGKEEDWVILQHRKLLSEIHRQTVSSFSDFRTFLIDSQMALEALRAGDSHL